MIEVFHASICGLCHKTFEFLQSRGLPYHAYEVIWDEANNRFQDTDHAREMYRRCGAEVDFVPQIFINGQHIPGWRKLEPMIQSGEFERLLKP
jgi:glutaredoxin